MNPLRTIDAYLIASICLSANGSPLAGLALFIVAAVMLMGWI